VGDSDARATPRCLDDTVFAKSGNISTTARTSPKIVTGNSLDGSLLAKVMAGQDIVYANLTGDDIDVQAQSVITAMEAGGVTRSWCCLIAA
jgi:hypothetical protein